MPYKVFAETNSACDATPLIISEVQTGTSNYRHEFVELYNCTDTDIDLSNYKLTLKDSSNAGIADIGLTGLLQAHSFIWVVHNSYFTSLAVPKEPKVILGSGNFNGLGADGGHIILATKDGQQINSLRYGNWNNDLSPVKAPPGGQSIKRCAVDGKFVNTNNNKNDFVLTPLPSLSYLFLLGPECPVQPPQVEPLEESLGGVGAGSSCSGVIISELMVNPAGADASGEFIELHNPTSAPLDLTDCHLETSANTKVYDLPAIEISPGEFLALYSSETKLTLENSAGGTVYLFAGNQDIDEVNYEASLSDDVSWSLIDGVWLKSYSSTPNAVNQLQAEKPCPAGEVRNTETDRCINADGVGGPTACKPGQERNPSTNRCRNIASTASALKACAADQVRNPETNRCRKADSSSLAPCKPGQERNPDTNRCRNITGASSDDVSNIKDVLAANSTNKTSWAIAAGTLLAATSYAVWEWRRELLELLARLKSKVSFFGNRL